MINVAQRRALWRLPISSHAKVLAALIADVQSLEQGCCTMSLGTLSRETGVSRSNVVRALGELRSRGLCELARNGEPTRRSIDLSLLCDPTPGPRAAHREGQERTEERTDPPSTTDAGPRELSMVLSQVELPHQHDEPERMLARLKFGVLVQHLGSIYFEPDIELHRSVAQTIRAYAKQRSRPFAEVLDEWLLEWVTSPPEKRTAGSWRWWVLAKGSDPDGGNPFTRAASKRSASDYRPLVDEMAPGVGPATFKPMPMGFHDDDILVEDTEDRRSA